jgi:multidrug efflux system membrane fusion protein
VKGDGTVEPRVVAPGRTLAGKVVIENGISPGDTVVTDGHLRLFPGARIRTVDAGKIEGIRL